MKFLSFIFVALVLALSLRGLPGVPSAADLNTPRWSREGPFELSPERGRFALTYSLIEDNSFYFSVPVARFTAPDLGYKDGHYVSLFAPGVSYITGIGYQIGKYFGSAQLGAFAIVSLFAVANTYLLVKIMRKLGVGSLAATLASFTFIFASPSFTYAVSLYQHHLSTFLILAALYLVMTYRTWLSLFLVWFLCAMSIPVDYPNLILMAPIGLYALGSLVVIKGKKTLKITLLLPRVFTFLGMLLPLLFFLWFNQQSYGNPWQFSGTVASVHDLDAEGRPAAAQTTSAENAEKYRNPELQHKSVLNFFQPRHMVEGLYLHLFSPDRGIIVFAPVMLLGILGALTLHKKQPKVTVLLSAIVVATLILYSLWGDPWGGWAFGSRYLVPAFAILAVFIGVYLEAFRRRLLPLLLFTLLAGYSIYVNTAGALSTSANPPQVQVLSLEALSGRRERYSYDRNLEFLRAGYSKSFVYQQFLSSRLSAWDYFRLLSASITTVFTVSVLILYLRSRR